MLLLKAFLNTSSNLRLLWSYREMANFSVYGETKSLSSGLKASFFNQNFIKILKDLLGSLFFYHSAVAF